ncbi:hypothetical protein RJ639_016022 [Escallonia herrerae]|uniref:CASP-like protein n=1 Tax=Escallonia herrerae TaxID=1293975 RepID=A0AA88VCL7_9ASTE|nr:hypothetical protein RJ639_016022 [Escallonia herrerae]
MAKSVCTIVGRIAACIATLTAALIMVLSEEKVHLLGTTWEQKYTYWSGFRYFVIANLLSLGFSLVCLILPAKSGLWRLVVVLDVIMSLLMMAAITTAWTLLDLIKGGNPSAGWLPLSSNFPTFCNCVMGALIPACIGLLITLGFLAYSLQLVINYLILEE